jgi:SPP1 family predicted phage head-tail adaptor
MLSARLSIYSKTSSLNSLGETALTTTLLRKIWAQEMSIKLSEEEESKSVKSLDKYKFKARYNTWLNEEHEIQFDGGVMAIDSVEPSGHQLKQWLIIKATRKS